MAELPSWIVPGDAATLVCHSGRRESADGMPLYQVAGPALDIPPALPYFLLAPVEREDFARFQNDAGVWSRRLHPFEFLKEVA